MLNSDYADYLRQWRPERWKSPASFPTGYSESRFLSQNKQSYCIMEPGMWILWSLCERAAPPRAAVAVGMCLYWQRWCEPDDRNHVNALIVTLIVNIRAITAAIRLLGYKTVLFTCLWLERELINGNHINQKTASLIFILLYFKETVYPEMKICWKDAKM